MKAILDIGVLLLTILMMFTVGMALEGRHFRNLAQSKVTLLLALLTQAVVLPLVGLVLTRILLLPPHLVAGLLLVAACPVGDIANFYTLLARGNVAMSVSLNTVSCLLSVLTTAAVFTFYGHLQGSQFVFAVATPKLVLRLTLIVAIPVLAGMGLRRLMEHEPVERLARYLRNGCFVGLGLVLVYVMLSQSHILAADWRPTVFAAAIFIILAMATGLVFGRALHLNPGDVGTMGIAFAVRNVALATAIAVTLLNHIEYAVFGTIYFLTEVPLLVAFVAGHRWVCRGTTTAVHAAQGAAAN